MSKKIEKLEETVKDLRKEVKRQKMQKHLAIAGGVLTIAVLGIVAGKKIDELDREVRKLVHGKSVLKGRYLSEKAQKELLIRSYWI